MIPNAVVIVSVVSIEVRATGRAAACIVEVVLKVHSADCGDRVSRLAGHCSGQGRTRTGRRRRALCVVKHVLQHTGTRPIAASRWTRRAVVSLLPARLRQRVLGLVRTKEREAIMREAMDGTVARSVILQLGHQARRVRMVCGREQSITLRLRTTTGDNNAGSTQKYLR